MLRILKEFSFGYTSVSDVSVNSIIEKLSSSLVKIDCGMNISMDKLKKLSKMPKLKVLNEKLYIATQCSFNKSQEEYQLSGYQEIRGEPRNFE